MGRGGMCGGGSSDPTPNSTLSVQNREGEIKCIVTFICCVYLVVFRNVQNKSSKVINDELFSFSSICENKMVLRLSKKKGVFM